MQDKIHILQAENAQLVNTQTELLAEIGRLREQQIKLRERNLRLTQECHAKQQECSVLMEQLAQFARRRNSSGQGDFRERKKKQPSTVVEIQEDSDVGVPSAALKEYIDCVNRLEEIAFPEFQHARTASEPNLSKIQIELDRVRSGIGSPRKTMALLQRNELSVDSLDSEEADVAACLSGFAAIKQEVLNQVKVLQNLSEFVNNQQSLGLSGLTSAGASEDASQKICPVCRDSFPSMCKSDYENHVLAHFEDDPAKCLELLGLDI